MTTAADVVAQSRLWIGTPFLHQARLRGVAVDCAGLIIGVGRELCAFPAHFDVTGYAPMPDGRTMKALCDEHLRPVPLEAIAPGHVALIAWGVNARVSHVGFIGDYVHGGLSFIHANQFARVHGAKTGGVVEHRLMLHAGMLMHAGYALPDVEG
jgi:cell wall-associated NlpC family hydrolase